ncbi:DUF1682 domain-containing protein [Adhaeribacter rhizoryzae]|uniref:Uncharacterized protein n=1 Tax=Adhaeribacter rhizoryzae TaxID=2607907 RepID=A0A5M6DUX9_9BACT|nr:DUF1682 domain-containing protein [Adhaeribacter rhizoryzae]KAA5549265.1 hypothetical protein F0145_01330 [Adhaeribacter rhizoryzae]
MTSERFKQKMAALEKDREDFISRLTPEDQQKFKHKERELNERADTDNMNTTLTWSNKGSAKNN